MYCLAKGIYSRYTKEELKNFLKGLDLVMIDLDGCIFPGITKVTMYRNVCLSLVRSMRLKNYLLLGRLLAGAVIISLMKICHAMGLGMTNKTLILYFARIVATTPQAYLQKAVESIPDKSYAGARETLEILSKKARLGIISQGLDIVLNEYVKQFGNNGGSFIDFWDGNVLSALVNYRNRPRADTFAMPISDASPSGNRLSTAQDSSITFIFGGNDKEVPARRRIAQFGSMKTMVIGHNTDDLGMMKVAKEHNGIIVGFNPTLRVRKLCDLIINGANWTGLREIFQEIV